jgi:hypothetical protein
MTCWRSRRSVSLKVLEAWMRISPWWVGFQVLASNFFSPRAMRLAHG